MKLKEFHITDFRAYAKSHGDTVGGGHRRIGSVGVDLPGAAGCQQDCRALRQVRPAPSRYQFHSADTA